MTAHTQTISDIADFIEAHDARLASIVRRTEFPSRVALYVKAFKSGFSQPLEMDMFDTLDALVQIASEEFEDCYAPT